LVIYHQVVGKVLCHLFGHQVFLLVIAETAAVVVLDVDTHLLVVVRSGFPVYQKNQMVVAETNTKADTVQKHLSFRYHQTLKNNID
jgi:hypothetical protein